MLARGNGKAAAAAGVNGKAAAAAAAAAAGDLKKYLSEQDAKQAPCNPMYPTLQPYVSHPATLCIPPCNPMYPTTLSEQDAKQARTKEM